MKELGILIFIFLNFSVLAQPLNVLISTSNRPNEPSICINPNNPNEVVAGTNLSNVYRSTDGGKTWKADVMTSSYGVWGDPVIVCDTAGHFYFFHLSNPPGGAWIDRIVCQKSEDVGKTWNDGSFMGLDGSKAQDKEWVDIDPRSNVLYSTWTQFDQYGSRSDTMYSNIMFSKSTDGGNTWTTSKRINEISGNCVDSSLTTEGAVPAVGPNGEIYVSWAGPAGLVFDKSTDGGKTWLTNDILIDSMKAGWTYDVPGLNRCNGLPVTACDRSNSTNRGNIYVNWTDQRNGSHNTDVFFAKSTDGGKTWSKPKRVNDDTTQTHQFLTWMTVDQSTGILYFIWYDRRNYTDEETDVYMAVSYDGGETFINGPLSAQSFKPSKSVFFGDYTNISAVDGNVRPIWTAMNNRQTEIWTALYTEQNVGGTDYQKAQIDSYPNPFSEELNIEFYLNKTARVKLVLYNLEGQQVYQFTKRKKKGMQLLVLKSSELELAPGTYVYILETPDGTYRNKVLYKP
jgi:hypothetical protein